LERLPRAKAIQTDDQEWMRLRLVQGEILRRLGRLDAAREHFERLRAERGDGAIEGVLAKLQLELIEKGDTERHVVPADVLERARSTSAWLKDRRPLLANGSRFEIIGQLPTKGRDSFQWDSTSRNIFVRDATAGASGITTHSIADGSISLTRALPYSIIDLLAALPTGNLLMLVQPSGLADDQARLIELDPKTSREVVSRLAGRRYARPGLVSFDRRFVLLGAEPDSLTAFATKGRTLERLPGPSERTFPLAMDQFGPRVILVDQRLNEGVIVWNYEQAREEFRFMFDQEERRFLPNILNAAVDVRRNALHVLWWTRHAGCKLATVELSTGRVLREQEEPGGRPLASLSLSGDGRYLAYECGPKVRVIDLASSKSVLETMTPPGDFEFNSVKFSPDSRYLAVDINSVASVLAVRP
jgi:WD40 repeat protein